MTFTCWYRSWLHGWRMRRAYARSLRSLRPVSGGLGLPMHRMSNDEVDATVVSFSWLARLGGMPLEDIAAAGRRVREAHAAMRNRRPSDSPH